MSGPIGTAVLATADRCPATSSGERWHPGVEEGHDEGSCVVVALGRRAESYDSADGARQAALAECHSRGGSGCVVRVWGCNGPVVEQGLGLDRAVRLQIQQGLAAAGFDPGGADGLFGPAEVRVTISVSPGVL